jgi:hypothetical protein
MIWQYPLILASLIALGALLAVLSVRGLREFVREGRRTQLMWGSGLALGAAAMAIEAIVYAGWVTTALLQAYIFLSAGIVGVLSLGATKVLRRPRVEAAYTGYMLASLALVAAACALVRPDTSMVVGGIISGNPPVVLLVLSSIVTFPATAVLLTASAVSLRRGRRWPTLLIVAGAVILGAGGTLYIASVPVALYYAEFLGILVLFLGLVSLPQVQPSPAAAARPAGSG